MDQPLTLTEQKALSLLGQGILPEAVASAVGVSPSRISQLLSQEEFAAQVIEARYKNLAEHTQRDADADDIETLLLKKLKDSIHMLFDPIKITAVLSRVNALKRRGQSAAELPQDQGAVVNLTMPVSVYQQFVTNINNQVIKAGNQELVTIQSGHMNKLLEASNVAIPNNPRTKSAVSST